MKICIRPDDRLIDDASEASEATPDFVHSGPWFDSSINVNTRSMYVDATMKRQMQCQGSARSPVIPIESILCEVTGTVQQYSLYKNVNSQDVSRCLSSGPLT